MIPALRALSAIFVLALASIVLMPLQLLAQAFNLPMKKRLPGLWNRIALTMAGVQVKVHGTAATDRPLMAVAGHSSWLDVPVLASTAPLAFVANFDRNSRPILARLGGLLPTLFANEGRKADAMVVFAEGRTNAGNSVTAFDTGLVNKARNHLEGGDGTFWIQPVSIAYTRVQGLPMGRQFRPVAAWTGHVRLLPHIWTVFTEYSVDAVVSYSDPIRIEAASGLANVVAQSEESVRIMTANVLTGRDPR